MSKLPSEKTQITNLKRMLREERMALSLAHTERNAYRARATVAEQAVSEWKARFDKLLERTPKDQS